MTSSAPQLLPGLLVVASRFPTEINCACKVNWAESFEAVLKSKQAYQSSHLSRHLRVRISSHIAPGRCDRIPTAYLRPIKRAEPCASAFGTESIVVVIILETSGRILLVIHCFFSRRPLYNKMGYSAETEDARPRRCYVHPLRRLASISDIFAEIRRWIGAEFFRRIHFTHLEIR